MFELLKLLILKGLKGLNFKDEKKVRSRQNLDDKGMKKKYIFFFLFAVAYLKIDILFLRTQSRGWEGDGGFKANFE